MVGIDLKLPIVFADNTFNFLLKGRTDVHWANNFLSTFRLSAEETIRQVCTKISRQSSDKIFLMLRPISFDVFRTNYQSQKPSRHRNISSCNGAKTLSLWLPWKSFSQQFSQRQREKKLANISGFRTSPDRSSQMRLSSGRQNSRTEKRSNDSPQRPEEFNALSRLYSIYHLLRCRHKQEICVFDKQLYSGRIDNRIALQMPLEDRTILQVDQTALTNQSILWDIRQCSQDTNLDRRQHLLARGHNEKRAEFAIEFTRNTANSQHYDFSKRPYYASTYENSSAKQKY